MRVPVVVLGFVPGATGEIALQLRTLEDTPVTREDGVAKTSDFRKRQSC